jgi:hypothetical protein
LTVQRIGCCTGCGRTTYAGGAARIVEAARTLEGDEPVTELRGRLMEFKVGDTRLAFYETRDAAHALTIARMTHGFTKRSQRTPRRQIDRGIWVMSQDEQ